MYYQTQPAALLRGAPTYGGGTVMMVPVTIPQKRQRLGPGQLVLGLGALASLVYLGWKARR